MRTSAISRTARRMTTLSMRQRSTAFLCSRLTDGSAQISGSRWPRATTLARSRGSGRSGPGIGGCCPSRQRFLSPAELQERRLPTPLEFGRDEPVVGVDPVELALGETGFVAETVNLLHLGPLQGLVRLTLRLARASPSVDFGGGDCCQKGG